MSSISQSSPRDAHEAAFRTLLPPNVCDECSENTPTRAARAWADLTASHHESLCSVRTFEVDAGVRLEMRDIPVSSVCEHHLLPFFGTATVSYETSGRAIGLSKIARVVAYYCARLQMQERITVAVAKTIAEAVRADVTVALECRHMCMQMRGVKAIGAVTRTEHTAKIITQMA